METPVRNNRTNLVGYSELFYYGKLFEVVSVIILKIIQCSRLVQNKFKKEQITLLNHQFGYNRDIHLWQIYLRDQENIFL